MACCVGFDEAKQAVEEVVGRYYASDAKIFTTRRVAQDGINYKIVLGIVVLPDVDKNTALFEDLLRLQGRSDICVRVIGSQIDMRDTRMVDLFLVEIETSA